MPLYILSILSALPALGVVPRVAGGSFKSAYSSLTTLSAGMGDNLSSVARFGSEIRESMGDNDALPYPALITRDASAQDTRFKIVGANAEHRGNHRL